MKFAKLAQISLGALLAVGLLGGIGEAKAEYPEKPITMIVPLGAGGSHDRNARVFTSIVPQYLGQPLIVKLMPGASGQVGTAAAAKAPADGYTLLFTHNYFDQLQKHLKKLPYDTDEAFVTVGNLNTGIGTVIVRSDSQFKTWQQVIDFAKANPGKVKWAHSGAWGATHTPALQLLSDAGILDKVVMVPYKGGGPSLRGMLAKEADLCIQFNSTIESQGDTVNKLITLGDKAQFEGVPTAADFGYDVKAGVMNRVLLAPRGIPADRLATLREAMTKLQEDKTYMSMMKSLGENTNFINGDEYEDVRKAQSNAYAALVKAMAGK